MIRFLKVKKKHSDYVNAAKIKYEFCSVEKMWSDLTVLFEKKKVRYIPVLGKRNEVLCLAYMKYWKRDSYVTYLERVLHSEKGHFFLDFFESFFSTMEIQICGFNEYGWRLYRLFDVHRISVNGIGFGWNTFYPQGIQTCTKGDRTSRIIWKITVEGEDEENPQDDVLLQNLELVYNMTVIQEWRRSLEEMGILFQYIPIPQQEKLQNITVDEQYRIENEISPYMNKGKWEDSEVKKHMPKKDGCEEQYSWEKWQEIDAKKEKTEIEMNGERLYYHEYGNGVRRFYLVGPCIVRGMCVSDENSLGSCIYGELEKFLPDTKVVCLSPSSGSLVFFEDLIKKIVLRKGDVVVFLDVDVDSAIENMGYQYERDIDLCNVYNERKTDYFWDCPIHTNETGNQYIAKTCVNEIMRHKEYFKKSDQRRSLLQIGKAMLAPTANEKIDEYLKNIKGTVPALPEGCKGAIVMNCNPMTNGHLYLIYSALEKVDFLYVFVVEEDKSEIRFEDRIEMVRRAVYDKKNVFVIPSGRFIISYATMPIYFEKESRQEELWDASADLQIFCERIAPELDISVRFMGEEPRDKITRQYNETLKEMAPFYGISLVQIPRLQFEGKVISAKQVRAYLNEGKFDLVQKLTPKDNWEILQKYL